MHYSQLESISGKLMSSVLVSLSLLLRNVLLIISVCF